MLPKTEDLDPCINEGNESKEVEPQQAKKIREFAVPQPEDVDSEDLVFAAINQNKKKITKAKKDGKLAVGLDISFTDNPFLIQFSFRAPKDKQELWGKVTYKGHVIIPVKFPDERPLVVFEESVKHFHVYPDGEMCWKFPEDWVGTYDLIDVLTNIWILFFNEINDESPADPKLARLMARDPKEYYDFIKEQRKRLEESQSLDTENK
mgnify:CR=1 FL=1